MMPIWKGFLYLFGFLWAAVMGGFMGYAIGSGENG